MIRILQCSVMIVALCAGAAESRAGELTPPAGPIAPTPGPEPRTPIGSETTPGDADSVYRISQPGSYYLTGNLPGVDGKAGIEIAVSGVAIDLSGFELLGIPTSLAGIRTSEVLLEDIEIRNGAVRRWGSHGIDLSTSPALNCIISDLRVSRNTGNGIHLGGSSTVSRCVTFQNGENGIAAIVGTVITDSTAYENVGDGFHVGSGCTIQNSAANRNKGAGIYANNSSSILGCSAYRNDGVGIFAEFYNVIADCAVVLNLKDGIFVTGNNLIRANDCTTNGTGELGGAAIRPLTDRNRIDSNSCTNNDRGIEVIGCCNFITRNFCGNNTPNWDIAAGNHCLVVAAVYAPAILGNAGGSSPGSTDPNANFSQ